MASRQRCGLGTCADEDRSSGPDGRWPTDPYPGAMPTPPRCVVREHQPRDGGSGVRERGPCSRVALGARAPNWSSFLLQRSCLASAVHWAARHLPLALGLCAPIVPRGRAANPRVVRVRQRRQTPGRDGRHSPGSRRRWPPSPGPHRWPPSTRREAHNLRPHTEKPNQGRRGPQPPLPTITIPSPAAAGAGTISKARRTWGFCVGQARRSTGRRASPRRR
jgi:hypothetical protein